VNVDTKILFACSSINTEIISNKKIQVDYYDFINIVKRIPEENDLDSIKKLNEACIIITSKNSINYLEKLVQMGFKFKKAICISDKTAESLNKLDFAEIIIAPKCNSESIISILKRDNSSSYLFLKGNIAKKDIEDYLKKNKAIFLSVISYSTILNNIKIQSEIYKAFCFTSPSTVESYFSKNKINENQICFAIGSTTAKKLKNYTDNIIISSNQTYTKLLETCINNITNNDTI
jgi:uroporphyrinogen-III synthase